MTAESMAPDTDSDVAMARAEAAESEVVRLREEAATRDDEIRRLEEALKKQAADTEALMKTSGSDREAELVSQLSEASNKVGELEKQVEKLENQVAMQADYLNISVTHLTPI